jgi:hypothetical protein
LPHCALPPACGVLLQDQLGNLWFLLLYSFLIAHPQYLLQPLHLQGAGQRNLCLVVAEHQTLIDLTPSLQD